MNDRILVVCDDLFFWARIEAAAQALGRSAFRVSDDPSMERAFAEGCVGHIVADLGARGIDAFSWARRWKARDNPPRLTGFVSHVDLAAQERAREAGFDVVVPKSRFVRDLSGLLRASPQP